MIFHMLELHSNFIAKNGVFGAVYCRMEPVLVQDLFISILLGISFWISERPLLALQPFIRTADLELLTNLDCYEVLTWNVAMLQKVHENRLATALGQ